MPTQRDQSRLRARLSDESRILLERIDELHELEKEKRTKPISTAAFHDLADTIKAKARDIFRITTVQERVGDRIETGTVTLNDVAAADPHRADGDAEAG
jgi:hypothetical protein